MGRVSRESLPDGYFHIVSRSVFGADVFLDGVDRRRFVRLLSMCEERHGWVCHAYCLMTTHYHLVIETGGGELSRGVHRLNGRYAIGFNKRHARFGHVFAERFRARVIEGEDYLFDACTYVVLNPVKAGLCNRVEDWRWSYSRYGLATT